MILGSLELLCLGVFTVLLILLVALIVLALLRIPREIPGHFLTREDAPPVALDTVFKLSHYFPLPEGYAYTEDENGAPAIVRIEDGVALSYTVEDERLTFREPTSRVNGTIGTHTHEVFRQH